MYVIDTFLGFLKSRYVFFTNELSDGVSLYLFIIDTFMLGADYGFCAGSCGASDGMDNSINTPMPFCCLNLHLSCSYVP